jgi:uncharacterized membrane protein YagU involved in acid resistance
MEIRKIQGLPTRPPRRSLMVDLVIGAIAGCVATVPMTVAASAMHRRLPKSQQYPLPPRELTERAAEELNVDLTEPTTEAATLVAHFGFGTAVGALFGAIHHRGETTPVSGGIAYAMAVWSASYLGWAPALGLLRPATSHPAGRNGLMLAAHVVWGAALGLTVEALSRSLEPLAAGELADRPFDDER